MVRMRPYSADEPVIAWLLENDQPSVRYRTLQDLLSVPADSLERVAARAEIAQAGPVPALLAHQHIEGYWDLPEKFYNAKYTGTVWNLLFLAELRADPGDPRIQHACDFIFERSQDLGSGGFSTGESLKNGGGLPGYVIPCLTGNLVYALIHLGYLDDPRVQRAIDWLVAMTRADDCDTSPPETPYYRRFEMCYGRHSCHMGVAKALKGLAAIPPARRTPASDAKITELAEYFLKHHLYKRSHNLEQVGRPGWLKFGFPLMYQTDILELLEIFADLDRYDPRLDDALAIVAGKRQPDGRWKLENTFNGKMLIHFEHKNQPSKWITYRALKVLGWAEGKP